MHKHTDVLQCLAVDIHNHKATYREFNLSLERYVYVGVCNYVCVSMCACVPMCVCVSMSVCLPACLPVCLPLRYFWLLFTLSRARAHSVPFSHARAHILLIPFLTNGAYVPSPPRDVRVRPLQKRVRLKYMQSGPENPSMNLVFLYKKTKTFVVTDVSAFFQFGKRYGSQNLLFDALQ